jgi:hypothetical protein
MRRSRSAFLRQRSQKPIRTLFIEILRSHRGMGSWARRCLASCKVAGLPGLRFAAWEVPCNPGAREVVGSNPTDPTKRGTPPYSQPSLGELLSFSLWMRKEGYRESTIQSSIQALKAVVRRANLLDPDSTKSYLASATKARLGIASSEPPLANLVVPITWSTMFLHGTTKDLTWSDC